MERLRLKTYVLMNLAFWAFCVLQYAILRIGYKRIVGVPFLLLVLAGGFTIVCLFDYLADRVFSPDRSEKSDERDREQTKNENSKS